jgi:tRNA-dihydrouridine synthase B
MRIGSYQLDHPVILAPMAGITDLPFRRLCHEFGAGLTVSEMLTSHPHLQNHHRTLLKAQDDGGAGLRSVQILGTEPEMMAQAARLNWQRGAQIIDINMGCPAKKVCSVAAGSALLQDESRVARILDAVVNAVDIPVTLKIRTGWDKANRNAVRIAQIAEQQGIQALTVHGRTRACKFEGQAEYDTIKQVKQSVNIPVIANGDIDSPEKARQVLNYTGADALMIGRAAQGNPWIFNEIGTYLTGQSLTYRAPVLSDIQAIVLRHLDSLYHFYGSQAGVRIARKHLAWYFAKLGDLPVSYKAAINQAQQPAEQWQHINASFNFLASHL